MRFLVYTSASILLVIAASCGLHDPSYDEVARSSNSSGKVDAVLIEINGGATSSFGYAIHLVPKGEKVSEDDSDTQSVTFYGAVRNANAYGVDLKWDGTNTLVAEHLSAKSAKVLKDTLTVAGERVTVTVRSNVTNAAAPPGGMLYNLRKHAR